MKIREGKNRKTTGQKTGLVLGPASIILGFMLASAFLSMWISNTATTEMILPILACMGVAMKTNPLVLMIPATISASCAFMMPVATPPNAIIFGSGRVKISDMAKVGMGINIIGAVVIATLFYFFGTVVFGIDMSALPGWAGPPGGG